MSKPKWAALAEKLQDPDTKPKQRRQLCRQLAATRDPQVITFLRNVYLQDEDEQVREAAYEGLAVFKAMQLGQVKSGLLNSRILGRMAAGLAVLFVISLILNGLVMALGGDSDETTERDQIIEDIETQLKLAQEDTNTIDKEIARYLDEGDIKCQGSYNQPSMITLSGEQPQTYGDLNMVIGKLNLAMAALDTVYTIWGHTCETQTPPPPEQERDLRKQLADAIFWLREAEEDLEAAKTGPEPSPTPPPTATEPPDTGPADPTSVPDNEAGADQGEGADEIPPVSPAPPAEEEKPAAGDEVEVVG